MSFAVKGSDMMIRIENLNLGICLNAAGSNLAFTACLDVNGLGTVAVNLEDYSFKVQNYLGYVLLNSRKSGEFVKCAVNLNGCDGVSRK